MINKGGQKESTSNVRQGKWKDREIRFRPNRIIVKFQADSPQATADLNQLVDTVAAVIPGGKLLRPPGSRGRAVFTIAEDADLVRVAEELAKRKDVEYAEPDVVDSAQVIPNDSRYADQWAHAKINSSTAWNLETGSAAKVLIGIIDSGISMSVSGSLNHPDLNQMGRYILGTDFVDGGTPRDLWSHGTHVTGIAAAKTNNATGVAGINWGSNVYICRTLDAVGNGSSADFADAVEEIVDYATAHSLKVVINYSAGGGANLTKQQACQYANDHGMILCAATGNNDGGPVLFPAAYSIMFDGVIAVGSTDSSDHVSGFSNIGPEVTVVAPGENILSTTPTYTTNPSVALNYDFFDGTSMATPLVAGLCSLMWSRHPNFTNKRIKECLTSSAKKLSSGSFDNSWGFGRIDAEKALTCGDSFFTWFTSFTKLTIFTRFTFFTKLTQLTRFTNITRFTRFTNITQFTRLTRFTIFTRHTLFTRITNFTRFREFTRLDEFTPFDREPDPRLTTSYQEQISQKQPVEPFLRYGSTIYDPAELALNRYQELEGAWDELYRVGFGRIDEIATTDPTQLVAVLGYTLVEANTLVQLCQNLMRDLAEGEEVPFEVVEGYIVEEHNDPNQQQ